MAGFLRLNPSKLENLKFISGIIADMELITALVKYVMEEIVGIQIYYFIGLFVLDLTIRVLSVYCSECIDGNIPKVKKKRKKRYRQGR
jgi:hypothetical protein